MKNSFNKKLQAVMLSACFAIQSLGAANASSYVSYAKADSDNYLLAEAGTNTPPYTTDTAQAEENTVSESEPEVTSQPETTSESETTTQTDSGSSDNGGNDSGSPSDDNQSSDSTDSDAQGQNSITITAPLSMQEKKMSLQDTLPEVNTQESKEETTDDSNKESDSESSKASSATTESSNNVSGEGSATTSMSIESGASNSASTASSIETDETSDAASTASTDDESSDAASTASTSSDAASTASTEETYEKETYEYSDGTVKVTATLQYVDAVPDDAVFKVTRITSTSDDYSYDAYMEALNENSSNTYDSSNTLLYDVGFFITEDGNEIEYEPTEGAVKISMEFTSGILAESDEIEVTHLPLVNQVKENADTTADVTDAKARDVIVEEVSSNVVSNGDSTTVSFELDSFSVTAFTTTTSEEAKEANDDEFLSDLTITYTSVRGITSDSKEFDFTNNNSTYTFPSDQSINDMTGMVLGMKIVVKDPYDERVIKAGDKLYISYPSILSIDTTKFGDGTTFEIVDEKNKDSSGDYIKYAECTFKEDDDTHELIMTFTENVSASKYIANIIMNLQFYFTFNSDALKNYSNGGDITISCGDNISIKITIPAISTSVSGITKKCTVDDDDPTLLNWTVTVGSDSNSKGVSLYGIVLDDYFLTSEQTYVSDSAKMDSTSITLTSSESDSYTHLSYTFGSDDTCPKTITYQTKITDSAIESAAKASTTNATTTNTAEMKEDEDSTTTATISSDTTTVARASAPIPVIAVTKQGYQLSSGEILWSIVVNSEAINVWKCDVYDTLSDLTIVDDSVKISEGTLSEGKEAETLLTTTANSDGIYYKYSSTDTISSDISSSATNSTTSYNKNTLLVEFNSAFSKTYTITFRTTVDSSASYYSDKNQTQELTNTANVVAYFPSGGTGTSSGTAVSYGTPTAKTQMYTAFISKTSSANEKSGIITWTLKPSTKLSSYSTAVLTDALPKGLRLDESTIKLTYNDGSESKEISISKSSESSTSSDASTSSSATYSTSGGEDEASGTTLTITIPSNLVSDLSNLTITYDTLATNYLEDNDSHTYTNSAKIVITPKDSSDSNTYTSNTATSSVTMQNTLLKKEAEAGATDDSKPYFKFTITVNTSKNSLNEVTITDNMSGIVKYQNSSDTETTLDDKYLSLLTSGDYAPVIYENSISDSNKIFTYNSSSTSTDAQSITIDGLKLTANLGNISDTYYIVFYLEVDTTVSGFYNLMGVSTDTENASSKTASNNSDSTIKLYAENKAVMSFKSNATKESEDATELTVTANTSSSATISTNMMSKSGTYYSDTSTIDWVIDINIPGTNLGTATLTDTIPKSQGLLGDSVKLYKVSGDTETEITKASSTSEVGSDSFYFTKSKDRSTEITTLTVNMPTSSSSRYKLKYSTVIITSSASDAKNNTATLTWGDPTYSVTVESIGEASSSSSASGTPIVIMKMIKVDSLSSSSTIIPIEGAKYGIFKDDSTNTSASSSTLYNELIAITQSTTKTESEIATELEAKAYDIAWTDSTGMIKFIVGTNTDYYIAEISAPETSSDSTTNDDVGYKRDTVVYGPYNFTSGGPQTISPKSSTTDATNTYFTDERDTSNYKTGSITITKEYASPSSNAVFVGAGNDSGYTSTFKIVSYPDYDKKSSYSSDIHVKETTTTGTYEYDTSSSSNEVTTTASTNTSGTNTSTLTITGLPWGVYGLTETKTQDGYALDTTTHIFKVAQEEADSSDTSGATITWLDSSSSSFVEDSDSKYSTFTNSLIEMTIVKKGSDISIADMTSASFYLLPDTSSEFAKGTTSGSEITKNSSSYSLSTDSDTSGAIILDGSDFKSASSSSSDSTDTSSGYSITLSGLFKAGTYVLKETSAPNGYSKISSALTIKVADNGTVTLGTNSVSAYSLDSSTNTITITDSPTAFTFSKKDQNDIEVDGATITLTGKFAYPTSNIPTSAVSGASVTWDGTDTSQSAKWTTNSSNNSVTFTGLLINGEVYKITETLTDSEKAYSISNQTSAVVRYVKVSDDGSSISAVTSSDDSTYTDTASDKTSALSDAKTNGMGIEIDKTLVSIRNHRYLANIKITKTDANDSATAVSGATFVLEKKDTSSDSSDTASEDSYTYVATLTTNANGIATNSDSTITYGSNKGNVTYENLALSKGLVVGTYRLREGTYKDGTFTAASPSGYAISDNVYTFTVTSDNDNKTIEIPKDATVSSTSDTNSTTNTGATSITNTRMPVNLTITKTDGTNALAGATYSIYTDNACTTLATNTSNSQNYIDGTNNFVATQTTASTSSSDSSDDTTASSNKITASSSTINLTFQNLAWGTYYIKETTPPNGYTLDETVHTLVIDASSIKFDGTTLNETLPGSSTDNQVRYVEKTLTDSATSLSIYKLDQYGNPATGVTLYISGKFIDSEGKEQTIESSASNEKSISYTVPEEYTANYPWVFDSNSAATDSTGKVVYAGYRLIAGEEYTITEVLPTTSTSTANSYKTPTVNSIKVKVNSSGTAFEIDDETTKGLTLTSNNIAVNTSSSNLLILNYRNLSYAAVLRKVSSSDTSTGLKGAKFDLYRSDTKDGTYTKYGKSSSATESGAYVTDATGVIITANLKDEKYEYSGENLLDSAALTVGYYYFEEVTAPSGYSLKDTSSDSNANKYYFEVTSEAEGKIIVINAEKTGSYTDADYYIKSYDDLESIKGTYPANPVTNDPLPGQIVVTKTDSSDKSTLKGAEITLYTDENCTTLATSAVLIDNASNKDSFSAVVTTGEDGTAKYENLKWGTYYIKETTPPSGYSIDNTKATEVTINASSYDSSVSTTYVQKNVSFTDTKTKFFFNKLDENDKAVSGAKLTISTSTAITNDTTIDTWTSDGSAHTIEGKLNAGETYYLTEETMPGYHSLSTIKFKVSDDGTCMYLIGDSSSGNTDTTSNTNENNTNDDSLDDSSSNDSSSDTIITRDDVSFTTSDKGSATESSNENTKHGNTMNITNTYIAATGAMFVKADAADFESDEKITSITGAKFNLYEIGTDNDGNETMTLIASNLTSDENGIVKIGFNEKTVNGESTLSVDDDAYEDSYAYSKYGLVPGNYRIVETSVPTGYKTNVLYSENNNYYRKYDFEISDEDAVDEKIIVIQQTSKYSETLTTTTSICESFNDGKTLANKYPITNEKQTGTIKLNKHSGTLSSETLVKGATYTIFKTKEAAQSYDITTSSSTTSADSQGSSNTTSSDGTVSYNTSENIVAVGTTGSSGYVTFSQITWGTYYIRETTAASGYKIDKNIYEINVGFKESDDGSYTAYTDTSDDNHKIAYSTDTNGKNAISTIDVKDTPMSLTLVKKAGYYDINSNTSKEITLEGAKFKLSLDGYSTTSATQTTDENGQIVFSETSGQIVKGYVYTLEEVTPPDGYDVFDTIHFKVVDDDGTVMLCDENGNELTIDGASASENVITITDTQLTRTLTVYKTDSITGNPVSGATYTLYTDGSSSSTSNDSDGTTASGDAVSQTIADSGSSTNAEVITATEYESGSFTEVKDEDEKVVTATTDANGKLTFTYLESGVNYYIKETTAPSGYRCNENYYGVVRFEESVDSSGNVLTGDTLTKALNKEMHVTDEVLSTFEVTTLLNYLEDVVNSENNSSVYNPDKTTIPLGDVTISFYTDSECTTPYKPSGTEYSYITGLTSGDGEEAQLKISVDKNATPTTTKTVIGLPYGKYYIKLDYTGKNATVKDDKEDNIYLVSWDESTKSTSADIKVVSSSIDGEESGHKIDNNTFIYDMVTTSFTFTKVDRENQTKTLEGSTYGLYRKTDTITGVTYMESSGDTNTTTDDTTNDSSTTDTTTSGSSGDGTDTDSGRAIIEGDIILMDTSRDTTTDGWTLVQTVTSGSDGTVTFNNLIAGQTYMILELVAPSGYKVSSDAIYVNTTTSTDSDGNVTATATLDTAKSSATSYTIDTSGETTTIKWTEPQLKLQIIKKDSSGNVLSGAKLQILDSSGNVIIDTFESQKSTTVTQSTTKDGVTTTTDVTKDGVVFSGEDTLQFTVGSSYILREVSAPSGYDKASDITFYIDSVEVGSEDYYQVVTMTDKKTETKTTTTTTTDSSDEATTTGKSNTSKSSSSSSTASTGSSTTTTTKLTKEDILKTIDISSLPPVYSVPEGGYEVEIEDGVYVVFDANGQALGLRRERASNAVRGRQTGDSDDSYRYIIIGLSVIAIITLMFLDIIGRREEEDKK